MKSQLTEDHYVRAAKAIRCQVAAIKAIVKVEAPKGPFITGDPLERATLLYEGHVMWKFAHKLPGFEDFARANSTLVFPKWIKGVTTKWYGLAGVWQYEQRYAKAAELDQTCARLACSLGAFQLMGFNHAACGFTTVDGFWDAMQKSVENQLLAFIEFIKFNRLDDELRDKRFDDFARLYNGAGQVAFYGGMIRKYFAQFGGK